MPADLDQGGNLSQWSKVWLGPTVGWVMLQVYPELFVTSASALVIQPFTSRVLLRAAVTAIALPDVREWLKAPFQEVQSAFDRSLWIKDLSGTATASPVVVTPFAGQSIDGLATYTINNDYSLIRLYPLNDQTGWYVG